MKNHIIATVTLGSLLVFSWSCYSVQEINPKVLATAKPGDYKIQKIEIKTGETVEYSDKAPGDVRRGQITGTGTLYAAATVEVDSAGLEIISPPGLSPMLVKTMDGKTYGEVKKIEKRDNKSVLYIASQSHGQIFTQVISWTTIEKAWAKKIDILATLIAFSPVILLIVVSIITHPGIGSGPWL
jgi:hypothetical protein